MQRFRQSKSIYRTYKVRRARKPRRGARQHWTKEAYQVYLTQPHWQEIRKKMYSRYNRCQMCKSKDKLNIHHLTYRRLGREQDEDLIVVCEYCHIEVIHKKGLTKKRIRASISVKQYEKPHTPQQPKQQKPRTLLSYPYKRKKQKYIPVIKRGTPTAWDTASLTSYSVHNVR